MKLHNGDYKYGNGLMRQWQRSHDSYFHHHTITMKENNYGEQKV